MRRSLLLLAALSALTACEDEATQETADATATVYAEGTRDARAAVDFLNDPVTDLARLKLAGVTSSTAAKAVLARRDGDDGDPGTDDDEPFETLADFDAVKGIGTATIKKVAIYARARGFGNERGFYQTVYFTEDQADRTLALVNTTSAKTLDAETSIDARALKSIEAARPILSMKELTSISRVKASATRLLREHADRKLGPIFCSHEDPCPSDLFCTGGNDAPGHCVDTTVEGSGESCSLDGACGPGLVCGGHSDDFAGICNPAWMRAEFVNEGSGSIPDGPEGGVGVSVQALGIGTVPTDAIVRVVIQHPRPNDLRLTLENTIGTVVPVWEAGAGPIPSAPEGIPVNVPSDESANGLWTLTVFDTVAGQTGTVGLFSLELISRFD